MSRSRPLQVERLEDRSVPAVFGLPWADATKLSLSFAPDGTSVDNQSSALFSTLNPLETGAWKTDILRAFQTWAAEANINIGLVNDGGQAFGVTGAVQGDSRFGDIRIGAKAHETHLAMNSPFNFLSHTRAGDVLLNTTQTYGIGNPNSFDLYSLMLQEAGNVLGIADNMNSASAMYTYYNGIRTGIDSSDVASVLSLYGAREADAFEGSNGNDSFDRATSLNTTVKVADITTLSDVDFYRFTALSSTMTVRAKAGGVSLMTPRLTIYDSFYNVVATAESTNPLDNTVTIQLDTLTAGLQYFVSVEATRDDAFGIGAYRLKLSDGPASGMGSGVNNNDFDNGAVQNDDHTNDILLTATSLEKKVFTTDTRFDHRLVGKLKDAVDVDWYKLTTPEGSGSGGDTMLVMVYGINSAVLRPKVTVYNSTGLLVASKVLVNDQGNYVVEVAQPAADSVYYLKVEAASSTSYNVGNYFLGVDFQPTATVLESAGSDVLHATNLQDWRTLNNNEGQVFQFVLNTWGDNLLGTGVKTTIYDSNNNVVFTLFSKQGETVTGNIYLAAGEYTIRFEGGMQDGSILLPVSYELSCINVTDPIDPIPLDPSVTVGVGPSFTWVSQDESYYSFLDGIDPYSNPWMGG